MTTATLELAPAPLALPADADNPLGTLDLADVIETAELPPASAFGSPISCATCTFSVTICC
ncbi:hypothetical protein [Streptomyces sp. NPDC021224]|uniref:hypothetical protein n=1 Tax=unclassified Streptomyces TaxID=2593676 RepID=UPI0037A957BF